MRPLAALAAAVTGATLVGDGGTPIAGLRLDSRQVQPGDLFVAIPGTAVDGTRFVPMAVTRGAVAVVAERPVDADLPQLIVPDARLAAGHIAAAWYGDPSRTMQVSGVTGTDGKTSTTHILQAIFEAAGDKTGVSSTVRLIAGDDVANPSGLTTPDPIGVQAVLAAMRDAGCRRAVLEVSSHALDQRRIDAVRFNGAICTNLDPEHLDYHGDFANYAAAKSRLFELTARNGGTVVINADDSNRDRLSIPAGAPVVSFGIAAGDVRATDIRSTPRGTAFRLETARGGIDVETAFVGRFNVFNWLAAAALALAEGVELAAIRHAAETARPVAGRLQTIDAGQPYRVIVDFAHTPQALSAAIGASRGDGALIVVVGHAGERDPANRPRMGAAGVQADRLILTMDDPYSEDPIAIAEAVRGGALAARPDATIDWFPDDRAAAIRHAFSVARPGDTVLIAGRGHEQSIVWGDRTIPFDDAEVARRILRETIAPAGARKGSS